MWCMCRVFTRIAFFHLRTKTGFWNVCVCIICFEHSLHIITGSRDFILWKITFSAAQYNLLLECVTYRFIVLNAKKMGLLFVTQGHYSDLKWNSWCSEHKFSWRLTTMFFSIIIIHEIYATLNASTFAGALVAVAVRIQEWGSFLLAIWITSGVVILCIIWMNLSYSACAMSKSSFRDGERVGVYVCVCMWLSCIAMTRSKKNVP